MEANTFVSSSPSSSASSTSSSSSSSFLLPLATDAVLAQSATQVVRVFILWFLLELYCLFAKSSVFSPFDLPYEHGDTCTQISSTDYFFFACMYYSLSSFLFLCPHIFFYLFFFFIILSSNFPVPCVTITHSPIALSGRRIMGSARKCPYGPLRRRPHVLQVRPLLARCGVLRGDTFNYV